MITLSILLAIIAIVAIALVALSISLYRLKNKRPISDSDMAASSELAEGGDHDEHTKGNLCAEQLHDDENS